MRGEHPKSESDVGTNNGIPKAIFVGGGFSDDELNDMMAIPEGKSIPWLAPDAEQKAEVRAKGPEAAMESIVARTKRCLGDHGLAEGRDLTEAEGKGGELWRF